MSSPTSARAVWPSWKTSSSRGTVEVMATALHHYLFAVRAARSASALDHMQQHVTIGPLRDETGIVGIVVTVEDVTARVEQERRVAGGHDAARRVRGRAAGRRGLRASTTDGRLDARAARRGRRRDAGADAARAASRSVGAEQRARSAVGQRHRHHRTADPLPRRRRHQPAHSGGADPGPAARSPRDCPAHRAPRR